MRRHERSNDTLARSASIGHFILKKMHPISASDFLSGLIVNAMATVKNRVGVCSRQILLNCAVARPVESNTLFCCGPNELQRLQLDQKLKRTCWVKYSTSHAEKLYDCVLCDNSEKSICWSFYQVKKKRTIYPRIHECAVFLTDASSVALALRATDLASA